MPITIKAGDRIEATVSYISSSGNYYLGVNDLTAAGQHYTKVTRCATSLVCARQSAEWIVERPTFNGVYTSLADWNTMLLTGNAAADRGIINSRTKAVIPVTKPISAFPYAAINMVNDPYTGELLASVGALDSTGTAFSDTWQAAQ
jgi:hypothetical protein